MAAEDHQELNPSSEEHFGKLFSSYVGLSFTLFLGHLPRQAFSVVSRLQTHKELTFQLIEAEEQLKESLLRRKEDSKANARVVEIFATHRHAWQQKERGLLQLIDEEAEEIARLRERVKELEKAEAELKRVVSERDEMLSFLNSSVKTTPFPSRELDCETGALESANDCYSDMGLRFGKFGACEELDLGLGMKECFLRGKINTLEEMSGVCGENNGFSPDFLNSASKFWTERASPWPDMQYESQESLYHWKHFVAREAPWRVDGESAGVSSKLKQLELELLNLETVGKPDLSKVTLLMQKQAKRYQAISGNIDDLCQRMQDSDPCEPTLCSEFEHKGKQSFCLKHFGSSSMHLKRVRNSWHYSLQQGRVLVEMILKAKQM